MGDSVQMLLRGPELRIEASALPEHAQLLRVLLGLL
jgi:hypothetical protein